MPKRYLPAGPEVKRLRRLDLEGVSMLLGRDHSPCHAIPGVGEGIAMPGE